MSKDDLKRKLTAILSADVEGYSRLMGNDEAGTIRTLTKYKKAMTTVIRQHRGRVVDAPGDNLLAEFASVVDAVQCAVDIQRELAERNKELPKERKMVFRIGVNLGDIIEENNRIYGNGVNIAARIESICEGGGVCISGTAFEHVRGKLVLDYEDLGDHEVKNIDNPVRIYRVLYYPDAAAHSVIRTKKTVAIKRSKLLISVAATLSMIGAVVVWYLYFHSHLEVASVDRVASPTPDKPSIAVLPFDNLSDDPKQEYFADGMTDELITHLSKISGLLVISRNSSFTYKGKTVKVQQVANELKVKYILEGSIQRVGDRVRIRAQLIDGATDHHLWAESYDAVIENIFDLQDEITKKIAAVLAIKLTVREQDRFAVKKTTNMEAYDSFVKGWEHLHRVTPDDLDQAISYFKQAIELDPNYSRAHAALAWTYLRSSLGFEYQKQIHVTESKLRLMARKYLELAMRKPTYAAHLVASIMALYRRQYENAVAHAQHTLAFDSNDADANLNMAKVLIYTGMPKEALEFVNKTIQLDPRNMAEALYTAGMAYFFMNDLQKSSTMIERALKHNPTTLGRYDLLAATYALLGRDQDAQAAYNKYLKIWGWASGPPDLAMLMTSFPLKDRKFADRLAEGLLKAGCPGELSGYYKIYEENKLTGKEIGDFVADKEIAVQARRVTFWVNHNKNGRTIFRGRDAKWWIEDDMLCYQRNIGSVKNLKDCGEIYQNPDATPGSKNQYLHVKDYGIYALKAVK